MGGRPVDARGRREGDFQRAAAAWVVGIYLDWPKPTDCAAAHRTLTKRDDHTFTVIVCNPNGGSVRWVTFRPVDGGLVEDHLIRDMHPLTSQRLDIWRQKTFNSKRLPAPEHGKRRPLR